MLQSIAARVFSRKPKLASPCFLLGHTILKGLPRTQPRSSGFADEDVLCSPTRTPPLQSPVVEHGSQRQARLGTKNSTTSFQMFSRLTQAVLGHKCINGRKVRPGLTQALHRNGWLGPTAV